MMGEFAIYSIRSAMILSLLFAVYMLTAGRLKCAGLRRWMLLSIYLFSLLAPVVTAVLPTILSHLHSPVSDSHITIIGTASFKKSYFAYTHIIDAGLTVMIAGSIVVAAMTLVGILWIARCRMRGTSVKIGDLNATIVREPKISPFSFGRRIFLSDTDYNDRNDMIIAHEASHIAHRHWMDLLVGRVVVILQWWNPLAWLMLRELHGVHEFQTDGDVISLGYDPREYQYLLLHKTIGSRFQLMTDSFNHSTLKSRIKMINRAASPMRRRLWSLLCIPALVAGCMAISSKSFADTIFPLTDSFRASKRVHKNDDRPRFMVNGKEIEKSEEPDIMVDGRMVDTDYLEKLDPKKIAVINIFKDSPDHPNGFIVIDLKR